MSIVRTSAAVLLSLIVSTPALPQQAATSSPQAVALLQRSLAALTGGKALTDVTLSGTVRRIAGSDDESGTAVFKALAYGAARTDLSLPSGQHIALSNLSAAERAGSWSGPDRVSHATAFHNLLTEPVWFFPAFAIVRRLSDPSYVFTYIGAESHNGLAVQHISVSQTTPLPDPPGLSFAHLTQIDFFLDSATLLPAVLAFNDHPDNDVGLDLPLEICFSDYRLVNGAQIPFHVQKFLNNTLVLDFQAQSITPNSGISASTFTVEAGR